MTPKMKTRVEDPFADSVQEGLLLFLGMRVWYSVGKKRMSQRRKNHTIGHWK